MIVVAVGSFCLGAVVAWLIRYFLTQLRTMTPKILTSVALLASGTAVRWALQSFESAPCYYFMGLFFGLIMFPILRKPDTLFR